MKYIRTKNGIYKISKILKNGDLLIKGKFHINKEVADKYFKQSDNLAELCDKFVIVFNNKEIEPRQFKNLETAIQFLKSCDKKYESKLKGAIWTSKGLIYVAKMNEKGEMVLI